MNTQDLHPRAEKRETARRLVGGREDREDDMKAMHGIGNSPLLSFKGAARIRRSVSDRKNKIHRLGFALSSPFPVWGLT